MPGKRGTVPLGMAYMGKNFSQKKSFSEAVEYYKLMELKCMFGWKRGEKTVLDMSVLRLTLFLGCFKLRQVVS